MTNENQEREQAAPQESDVCAIEDVFTVKKLPDEDRAKLAEYLSAFQPPKYRESADGKKHFVCPNCGNDLLGLIGGSFQWGLVHGEGFCTGRGMIGFGKPCGWPIRMYHFDIIGKGSRLNFPLAYHPNQVTTRPTKIAATESAP